MNYSNKSNDKNRKQLKSSGKRVKNKASMVIMRVALGLFLVGIFSVVSMGLGAYRGILEAAPELATINQALEENYTTIIYSAATGEILDKLDGGEMREFVDIDHVPLHLQHAFVAIEDERFYEHDGVDYYGFARATYQTLFKDSRQGGSTITQQVIKNKRGLMRNSIETKLQEQQLALQYEANLTAQLNSKEKTKDAVLETYLNIVPLGKGQIGVKSAALRYFNKDISELTLSESTVLSAITQNPYKYNPIDNPENNHIRRTVSLDKMLELNFISVAEYDEALNDTVYDRISYTNMVIEESKSYHSYFVDQVVEDVIRDLGLAHGYTRQDATKMVYNGGLSIYATVDDHIQEVVDRVYLDDSYFPSGEFSIEVTHLISIHNEITGITNHHEIKGNVKNSDEVEPFIEKEKIKLIGPQDEIIKEVTYAVPQPQSSMVILDYHTGQVKAIAGGRGEKLTNRGLNRATNSLRQPGSVFKVVAGYAPAIDTGMSPASTIDDVPFTMGKWSPRNHNGKFAGYTTLRSGVKFSMNVVTVKTMQKVGIDRSLDYLKNFGFNLDELDYQLATSLGGITYGVTQLEQAAAYGTIANGGGYIKPYFYTKVENHEGVPILENSSKVLRQVLKPTSAYLLTTMLRDAVNGGTGSRARIQNVKMPSVGKTGTATANKDYAFAGFTPYYSASIWLGHDLPKGMAGGIRSHLEMWRYIMEEVHKDLEYKDFVEPAGIVTKSVCGVSGLLPKSECSMDPRGSMVRSDIFDAASVPTKYCDKHQVIQIDTVTGYTASEFCPPEDIGEVAGIIRTEGAGRAADSAYEISMMREICPVHTATWQPEPTPSEIETPLINDGDPTSPGDFTNPLDPGNEPVPPGDTTIAPGDPLNPAPPITPPTKPVEVPLMP